MKYIMFTAKNRSRLLQALLLFVTFGVLASCAKEYEPFDPVKQREKDDKQIQEYLQKNNVDMSTVTKTNSGLYYQLVEPGTGAKVESGDNVEVHYTGILLDGTKFDSSVDRNETFVIRPIGANKVISGWDEGVKLMHVGEKARLYIPSHLAYGTRGSYSIPPNTVLIFDIEIISIQ
ncbi:FKBP-type peptidyl-prolyl cis-trans isomerase [Pontibacter sp. E15-1]|uniref:FKBP-type peptidyl-prolyl cis-trans isomerase n=1 Tax=Pontibacter sp. E15-1 TaxID=2919918 RepID=UPI001F4F12C5|nr:FKBP-type peptidyl-prolyl cis-trans isomerase [Pontibacter sp. E15-1]MCJ8166947.1 FKBP-type peptidyl-prolyl cis-trans isomerase [Pontibacter sp. E15-1]